MPKIDSDITLGMALKIQADQIAWYAYRYPGGEEALAQHMAHLTHADDLALNIPRSIFDINRMVPRGGRIESIIHDAEQGFCHVPKSGIEL